jgi:3-oxoacyl-[acyl-carrier-protein] synthase-3
MAAVAGLRAIHTAGLAPDDIDLIIVATLSPDYWMPSTAALVKEAIGNTRAPAFDVSAACSGFVYAYATATAYLGAGMARHALVIGAELLTRFLDYEDRGTCILFGDGAGAVVLSATEEATAPVGIELTTDPQGAYMIWLPAGGSKSPPSSETVARGEHKIRMEGKETYRFATRTLASTALAAVGKAGWTQDDVDLIIPHQANVRIIEAVARGLDLSMDKIYVNLHRYGNTSAASVPIALAEAVNEGRVKVGDKLVFVAFGAGFTSGAVALEWTADPTRGSTADEAVRAEDAHGGQAAGVGLHDELGRRGDGLPGRRRGDDDRGGRRGLDRAGADLQAPRAAAREHERRGEPEHDEEALRGVRTSPHDAPPSAPATRSCPQCRQEWAPGPPVQGDGWVTIGPYGGPRHA